MSEVLNIILINTIMSSALILFVLGAKAIFKNKIKPALISALWLMVLARLLLPFSIESPINIWSFMPEKPAEAVAEPAANEYTPTQYTMEGSNIDVPAGAIPTGDTGAAPDVQPAVSAAPTAWQKIKDTIKSIDIPALSASIWIICALGIVGLNIIKMMIFALYKGEKTIINSSINDAFLRAKAKLGIKTPVEIAISKKTAVPIAYGLLSPKILVPESIFRHMDSAKIELILMHELMHIKRLDILKNYLWLAAKAMYWFNPLVWIAHRLYVSDTEIVCDYHVMKRLNNDEKIHYSQSLLDAAKLMNKGHLYSAPYMLSFCESETKLRRRIMNILQPIKQSKKQTAVLAILITVLAFASFTTACQTVQPSPTPMATMPVGMNNADAPTPTPQIIDFDADGSPITATYSPEATPEAFSLEYMQGKTITNSIDGLDMTVNFQVHAAGMPSAGSFTTAEVETYAFDADFAKKAADYFLGDVFYADVLTKSDYEKRLTEYTALIDGVEMSESDREEVDNYLRRLNDGVENAPTENTEKPIAFENGVNAQQVISLKSYTEYGAIQEMIVDNTPGENESYTLFYAREDISKAYYKTGKWYEGDDSSDDKMVPHRRTALDAVSAICDKEMRIVSVEEAVVTDAYDMWTSYEDLTTDESKDKCYIFYFVPVIDKTACVYGSMAKGPDAEGSMIYDDPWLCEYIKVVVDKDGLLELTWTNPQNILTLSYENAVPITLNDAIAVFEENIWDSEAFNDSIAESSEITITQIEYGLVRITDEDGTQRLISAYAFLGSQTSMWPGGREVSLSGKSQSDCFMLVDALTGEVIDFYN